MQKSSWLYAQSQPIDGRLGRIMPSLCRWALYSYAQSSWDWPAGGNMPHEALRCCACSRVALYIMMLPQQHSTHDHAEEALYKI